jgi:serine/threonine-protein kinase
MGDAELERQIDALCRAGKLRDAAGVAARAGAHARAAELFERACSFREAALEAEQAGRTVDALRLAALAGDEALGAEMVERSAARCDRAGLASIGAELAGRGHHRQAGLVLRAAEAWADAAAAFERSGAALEAARCHEQAGQLAQAARVLEEAVAEALRDGDDDATQARRLAAGELYARHGKDEAALRALQQLPEGSPWRVSALPTLERVLARLGLRQAADDAREEARASGAGRRPSDGPPEDASERAAGERLLYGRYRVVREVATTPHARVLEAVDVLGGERVALKLFAARPRGAGRDALARFAQEARALARLRHPAVVALRDHHPEGPAMVLEWMPGGSLADLLADGPLVPTRAAEIACAVLGALGEAHRIGILHRDVKPSNVLLDGGGAARLADFGAAHLREAGATVTAAEIGSAGYMAPEQRDGRRACVQSDVYAVGVLLHEMLTGAKPSAAGATLAALARAHPDLGAAHAALLERMLALEASHRPASAHEARLAVAALPWPSDRPRAPVPTAPAQAAPTDARADAGERLAPRAGREGDPAGARRAHDRWLERDVLVVPLDEAALACAGAFARAGHPSLATVLRVDPEAKLVWIDAPEGRTLSAPGEPPLTTGEIADLGAALAALHRAGGVHGAVNAAHIHRSEGSVVLAYPPSPPPAGATDADDRGALARLAGRSE